MTKRNERIIYLSASAIAAFKRCPMLFKAKYIAGIIPIERTEGMQAGTDWGSLLEVAESHEGDDCPRCAPFEGTNENCLICGGTRKVDDDAMTVVSRLLEASYPMAHEDEKQAQMKSKLYMSIAAYMWHWDVNNPEYDVLATEVPFDIKILDPETGSPCRDGRVRGKLDRLIRIKESGTIAVLESKSTDSAIDDGSGYWDHMDLDTQTLLYPYAMWRLQQTGELERYGIKKDDPIATTVLYDVWHKPGIKMKKLSMAESKRILEDEEYVGEGVSIAGLKIVEEVKGKGKPKRFLRPIENDMPRIDGVPVTLVPNVNGDDNAIYENEVLYGARVFGDITADPDKYFARREISRTIDDMAAFEGQLFSIYRVILDLRRTDHWWQDERACKPKGTYTCPMIAYCWHREPITSDNILDGFECKWEKDDDVSGGE
ncbi:hypothetical protein LCGC14_0343070 [marine sediment metagenome]|uniref:PD-(D/E)XK endonuclease-like domain-containing protein n=1 Tax=marine sediment metagenome TaxID=412755 RepID=A0A0F9TIN2_9ZZZZ